MIKFLPFILLILLSCNGKTNPEQVIEIRCEEYGMASNNIVRVRADSIFVRTSPDGRKNLRFDVKNNAAIWRELEAFCEELDLKGMNTLESPSFARAIDGAYYSHIEVWTKTTKYISSEFDSGTPPEELKELYEYMYSRIEDSLVKPFRVPK